MRLVLVPTELERMKLLRQLKRLGVVIPEAKESDPRTVKMELCGFGPVASAARAMQLLIQETPRQVVLAGIAGSFTDLRMEGAYTFREVAMGELGVRERDVVHSPKRMGFPQWSDSNQEVFDRLSLVPAVGAPLADLLLTVPTSTGDLLLRKQRLQQFPRAAAEDMEAFGVAMACLLRQCPLTVIRGISNRVGDRDPQTWKIDGAIESVARALLDHLGIGYDRPE